MRGSRIPALGLACALLAVALPAAGAPKRHAAAKKQAAAAEARTKALLGFQRDLVSVLAPRADALPLLGAALLARPLPDQPKVNSYPTLIARAAQAADAGPAVSWAQLPDCDDKADACPNAHALERLLQQAPDNAAAWMLKLGQDLHDMHKQDAREDLSRAAAARLYDDYGGTSLKALAYAVAALPPPPATLDPAAPAGAAGVQVAIAFGLAAAQPQPGLRAVAGLCKDNADDAGFKADCLKLGKVLEWGSSPLARSLGLHLRETLDPDPARQQDAREARRVLVWQVQNFAQLAARAQGDKALAQHLLALARNGGTQMSLVLAALRGAGIPTDPPADWQPPAPE
ncbi:hypothetical protein QMK61_12265 [Fulvimonas sp. R45]|uniref:hypothetical protein n=1 Tax=Fulvimonas sp. R45 TaxID=3045937 RepID=UPI00265DF934|nr:hypothetical protein [Fulvimonas sp. R45]MDO1529605.1 hypothetical protein [Fulvimonas sp. R45]